MPLSVLDYQDGEFVLLDVDADGAFGPPQHVSAADALRFVSAEYLSNGGPLELTPTPDGGVGLEHVELTRREFYDIVEAISAQVFAEADSTETANAQIRAALTNADILAILVEFGARETVEHLWPNLDELLATRSPAQPDPRSIGGDAGGRTSTGPPLPPAPDGAAPSAKGPNPPGDVARGGDPVLLASGEFIVEEVDLALPGVGLDVTFARTYRHRATYDGPMGRQWDHSFNLWLREAVEDRADGGRDFVVYRSAGCLRMDRYVLQSEPGALPDDLGALSDGVFVSPHDVAERLVKVGGAYVLTDLTGARVEYGATLQAETISDANGNTIRLEYDDRLLVRLIDTCERVVAFEYDDQRRLQRLRDLALERWVDYAYDTDGRLIEVNFSTGRPGAPQRCHAYLYWGGDAPPGMDASLVGVIDASRVMTLEVSYGGEPGTLAYGRVVEQFDRGGYWRYDYQWIVPSDDDPGLAPRDPGLVRVTVTSPDGTVREQDYNALGRLVASRTTDLIDGVGRDVEFRYAYDADARVVGETRPDGSTTAWVFGRQVHVEAGGSAETATDSERARFGELRQVIEYAAPGVPGPGIRVTDYRYGAMPGLVTAVVGPFYAGPDLRPRPGEPPPERRLFYDDRCNLERVEYPDCTLADGVRQTRRRLVLLRDDRGRLIERRLPRSDGGDLVTRYEYHTGAAVRGCIRAEIEDAEGVALRRELDWDHGGRLMRVREADGYETTRTVDHFGCVLAEESAPHVAGGGRPRTEVSYTLADQPARIVRRRVNGLGQPDAAGSLVETFDYDLAGRLQRTSRAPESGGVARERSVVHDVMGRPARTIDEAGMESRFEYTPRGGLARVINGVGTPEESSTRHRYDVAGRLAATIDPVGRVEQYAYDGFGRLASHALPGGTRRVIEWDAEDRQVRSAMYGIDPDHGGEALLTEERMDYDEGGRLRRLRETVLAPDVPPVIAETRVFYDSADRVIRIEQPEGVAMSREYDGLGRLTATEDAEGNRIEWIHDAVNRTVVETRRAAGVSPDGSAVAEACRVTTRLDGLGHPLVIEDDLGNRRTLRSNSDGGTEVVVDEAGVETHMVLNAFGEVVGSVVAPGTADALSLTVEYDARGAFRRVDGFRGRAIEVERDGVGRERVRRVGPEGPDEAVATRACDVLGRLVRTEDENGVVTRYHYDDASAGQLTRMSFDHTGVRAPAGAPWFAVAASPDVTFEYDTLGRLSRASAGGRTVERRYDSRGLVLSERVDGSGPSFTYDLGGRRRQLVFPGGRTLEYRYDRAGRLIDVRDDGGGEHAGRSGAATLVRRWPIGPTGETARSWGPLSSARHRDAAGRPSALSVDVAGVPLASYRRICDARGAPAVVQSDVGDQLRTTAVSTNRRGEVVGVATSAVPGPVPAASLSAAGSQHALDALAAPFAALAAHDPQATRIDLDLAPDGARTRVRRRNGASDTTSVYVADGRARYTSVGGTDRVHDGHGNLVASGALRYTYDESNQLVAIRDAGGVVLELDRDPLGRPMAVRVRGAAERRYVHDANGVLEVRDDGDGLVAQMVHGAAAGDLVQVAVAGENLAPVLDVSGSVVALVDANGAVVERRGYGPFGEDAGGPPAPAADYGFHGVWQPGAGLPYLMPQRAYDPETGAFLQPDPFGIVDGIHPYRFAHGNPYAWTDTSGLAAQGQPPHGSAPFGGGGSVPLPPVIESITSAMLGVLSTTVSAAGQNFLQVVDAAAILASAGLCALRVGDGDYTPVSGVGQMAAAKGLGTVDLFAEMGRGAADTLVHGPGRAWAAAERGDWYSAGAEATNFAVLARGAAGLAKGFGSLTLNKGLPALARGLGEKSALGHQTNAFLKRVRKEQVSFLKRRIERIYKGRMPKDVVWEYAGSSGGRALEGSYTPGSQPTIRIYEEAFNRPWTERLPSTTPGSPYAWTGRIGWRRLLMGESEVTTAVHEGWHAIQDAEQSAWFRPIDRRMPGNVCELTPSGVATPLAGAYNVQFDWAPPTPFTGGAVWSAAGAAEATRRRHPRGR